MKFWVKKDEILGGRWIEIGFLQWLWFCFNGIVTCISSTYPPESKDRGYAHFGKREKI